jgi:alkylation response protein AidB-like acyl-CoA dehydrogenase
MPVTVTEQQAREVVEAAREAEWKPPSFGKELFLGNFRLDLIHPQPPLDPTAVEKGERFLERLRAFLQERVDPLQIERDAKIPESVIDGLKQLGALGMKVPEQYGGLGLSQVHYNRGDALAASSHVLAAALGRRKKHHFVHGCGTVNSTHEGQPGRRRPWV